jgi:predicted phosphodiesterase
MRLAIFSDVHGNLTALDAVLSDINKHDPDLIVFAGDLCVFGARPAACVQRIRAEDISCIYGNTDGWINNDPLLSDDIEEEEKARSEDNDTAASWTWAELEEEDRAWLRTWPFQKRFSPTVHPKDDLVVVHANPRDVDQPIHPSISLQEQIYGEVKQTDEDLRPLLGEFIIDVLCFGHIHIPNVRTWNGLTLANISSVSLPLDGDVRAKYGLLTWDDGWTIEHRRVEYDLDQEVEQLQSLKPPQWKKRSRQLQTGNEA